MVGYATRRTRVGFFLVGSLLLLACALSLSDGDGLPFLAGLITFSIGAPLFVLPLIQPVLAARRMPSSVTEPYTCDIDDQGIRLRGSTWTQECRWETFRSASLRRHLIVLHQEKRVLDFALPRAAFAGPPEATLVRILRGRRLLR